MNRSKIIIVDDEKKIVKLIKSLIDWNNLSLELVGTANDGISALDLIKNQKPDIVILDMKMPGFNGIELICKAKEIFNDLNFIIISGYKRFEYAHNAIKYGVEDYLLKPVQADELNKALSNILNKVMQRELKISFNGENTLLKNIFEQRNDIPLVIANLTDLYNVDLSKDLFKIILLKNDLNTTTLNRNEFIMLQTKTENIVRKKLDDLDLNYFLYNDNNGLYMLLNVNEKSCSYIDTALIDIIEDLHSIKDLFRNLHTTISVGDCFDDINLIFSKKNDVLELIADRIIVGCDKIITKKRSQKNINIKDLSYTFIKNDIVKYTEILDEINVKRTLDSILMDLLESPDNSGQLSFDVISDILADVYFILKIRAENPKELENELTNFKDVLNNQSTLSAIFSLLINKICALIREQKDTKENREAQPITTAKEYINDNFFMNLTLNEVSEFVEMNPTYFSSLFKKETGIGFLEYLTGIRIEEAKELLGDPKRLISDTASEVGYKDTKHFTKQFKKIVGLSPIEYRKIYY
ncbi:MAG: response regulator [Spirochaetaceae bacterium]